MGMKPGTMSVMRRCDEGSYTSDDTSLDTVLANGLSTPLVNRQKMTKASVVNAVCVANIRLKSLLGFYAVQVANRHDTPMTNGQSVVLLALGER